MATKITKFLEKNSLLPSEELASKALLELFGDEETYNRYVLTYYNSMLDKCFGNATTDCMYIQMLMDQRNFKQAMHNRGETADYKSFSEAHSINNTGKRLITEGFNSFLTFELGAFACGVLPTKETIRRYCYFSKLNDNCSAVDTPAVVKYKSNHPNMKFIKEIGVSREKSLPYLFMDDETLCAFTQFRMMVYNKYVEYKANGIQDRVYEFNDNGFVYNKRNSYIAYKLAVKDTCELFATFFPPDMVKFRETALPYSVGTLTKHVGDIRAFTKLKIVGNLDFFDSGKLLPSISPTLLNYDRVNKLIANKLMLNGKYSPEKYSEAMRLLEGIMSPHSANTYDATGFYRPHLTPANVTANRIEVNRIVADVKVRNEIDTICEDLLTKTRDTYERVTYKPRYSADKVTALAVSKKLDTRLCALADVYDGILADVEKFNNGKSKQLPMFNLYKLDGQTITIGNFASFIDSRHFPRYVNFIRSTADNLRILSTEVQRLNQLADEVNVLAGRVEESTLELYKHENRTPAQLEHDRRYGIDDEKYRYTDSVTGDIRLGVIEERNYHMDRIEYREKHKEYIVAKNIVDGLEEKLFMSVAAVMGISIALEEEGLTSVDLLNGPDIVGEVYEIMSEVDTLDNED